MTKGSTWSLFLVKSYLTFILTWPFPEENLFYSNVAILQLRIKLIEIKQSLFL